MIECDFRFKVGDAVWVRDLGKHGRGYRIEQAIVREQHYHPGRHPAYPNGEGYALDGNLWWDCYAEYSAITYLTHKSKKFILDLSVSRAFDYGAANCRNPLPFGFGYWGDLRISPIPFSVASLARDSSRGGSYGR